MTFHSGKEAGTTFEKLFERQCLLAGLWAEPNYIKAKRVWDGRLRELKSNLDYTVIKDGQTGFFDCKTFDSDHFTFSQLPEHQVELARKYNQHGVPGGFVVWFRPINQVSFFPGGLIAIRGPKSRFEWKQGFWLGPWERFDPRCILDPMKIIQVPSGSGSGILP